MAPQIQTFIVLGLLSSFTSAWPVFRSPVDLIKRVPQSYSVVAVDGGSTATATIPATRTVTDAVTQIQTSVQTSVVFSTIVATAPNASPATTVIPQTVTNTVTTVNTTPVTVTIEPSVSSVPYDDGQWHTTYFFRSTVTPSANVNVAAVTSSSSSAPSPTTSVDLGQWAPWSGQNGGSNNGQ